jgi:hypothetical protein
VRGRVPSRHPQPPLSRCRFPVALAVTVDATETSASAGVVELAVPRRRGAPPCRAPAGIQRSTAAPTGIHHSAAPARPCAADDLRRAVGRRRHGRRSPVPPPPEIPSSPRSRPPPSESRPTTRGELRDERAWICRLPLPAAGESSVTTPSEIIPYYRLNHSIWSLSDNKEPSC